MGNGGRQLLLDVAQGYTRAITEGRVDEVLQDLAIHVWRHDQRVEEVPRAALEAVDELLDRVHTCIMSGAEDDALLLLDELQRNVLSYEA